MTALISGVAIFVNGHAVQRFGDATVYTTAKNAVAGALLLALALPVLARPGRGGLPADEAAVGAAPGDRGRRRQRAVRALLRGPRPRGGDSGRIHPEDARGLGGAPRGATPPRASRPGALCGDRSPPRRPDLARGRRGDGRLRHRRGSDPRGDAPLGGRGGDRQMAAGLGRLADTRGRPHGGRNGRTPGLGRGLRAGGRAVRAVGEPVELGAPDGPHPHGVRRDVVRCARPGPGRRRDGGARLRRGRDGRARPGRGRRPHSTWSVSSWSQPELPSPRSQGEDEGARTPAAA